MNNYYLIAFDSEPKIIELTLKLDGQEIHTNSTTIQNIDSITYKYDIKTIKEHLFNKGKISSMDIEIAIVHQSRYKGEKRLKFFPVLTKNKYLHPTDGEKIKVGKVKELIVTFFNKYKNDEFQEIADYYYTDLDGHDLNKFQIIFSTLFKDESIKQKEVDYKKVRKLISILTLYNRFKDKEDYMDYLFKMNRYMLDNKDKLLEMTDSNIIQGQISFSFDGDIVKYNNMNDVIKELELENEDKEIEQEDSEIDYYELYDSLSSKPWDDPFFEKCSRLNCFPEDAAERMTLEDKVRAGMITDLNFKKEMIKRNEKRSEKRK